MDDVKENVKPSAQPQLPQLDKPALAVAALTVHGRKTLADYKGKWLALNICFWGLERFHAEWIRLGLRRQPRRQFGALAQGQGALCARYGP